MGGGRAADAGASVPVAGFSRELRAAADAERFWFSFPLRGDVALPVHVLFSRAARTAEVKAADLKVHRFEDVDRATDARRQWIGWWQSTHRPHRSRGPSPVVPRRVGRLPVSLVPDGPPARRPLVHAVLTRLSGELLPALAGASRLARKMQMR